MRKYFMLFAAAAALCVSFRASAEVIGEVTASNIGALIDGSPVHTYNIDGSLYIEAEELRSFGFEVIWDETAKTLNITPDSRVRRTIISEDDINIKKSDIPEHKKLYDVYATDIKTYLNGAQVSACNIDGRTLVKLADFSSVGYVSYDDEKRLARLDVIKYQLDAMLNSAADTSKIEISDGVTYIGQVKDGKPDGVGARYDKSAQDGPPARENDITTVGVFSNGELSGMYYSFGTYSYTTGKTGTYQTSSVGNTNINYEVADTDYHVSAEMYRSISTIAGMPVGEETGVYVRGIADNEYLYCFNCDNSIYNDGYTSYNDGDINVLPLALPEFTRFASVTPGAEVVAFASDGGVYTAPYGLDNKKAVAVFYGTVFSGTDVKDVIYNSGRYTLLDGDGNLYMSGADGEAVLIARDVSRLTESAYVTEDGSLYDIYGDGAVCRAVDTDVSQVSGSAYTAYVKNDGSLWTYRSEAGYDWIDETDYSVPVKRADDVLCVSADSYSCMYVKTDGTLWGFGLSADGLLGYAEPFGNDTSYSDYMSREHIKLGDNFVSCKAVSGAGLALDINGDLWGFGAAADGEENALKLASNVADYAYSCDTLYIIKNDGTLWFKGVTPYNRNRGVEVGGFSELTQCTEVCRKTK